MHVMYFTEQPMSAYPSNIGLEAGHTALMRVMPDLAKVRLLVERGANVNAVSYYLTHHSTSARLPSEPRCRQPSGRGRSVALHDVGCGGY